MNFFDSNKRTITNVVRLAIVGLLISLSLIFTRIFSFQILNNTLRIGFGELPILIAGIVFGPIAGMLTGGIADFVGATFISPFGWYPPLTIAPILLGLISGTMWYFMRKMEDFHISFIRIFIVILTSHFIANIVVGTYWLSVLMNTNFWALVFPRAILRVIMTFLESYLIYMIYKTKLIKVMRGSW